MSGEERRCVTCADEALPLRVERVEGAIAICDGVEVMIDLVAPVEVGETLLVHAGVALARAGAA